MLSRIEVKPALLENPKYRYLFSVEEVNRRVLAGMTFRDAYREVGLEIDQDRFEAKPAELRHTHEGSLGHLCNREIRERMNQVIGRFPEQKIQATLQSLTSAQG